MSFLDRIRLEKNAEVERLLAASWPDTTGLAPPRSLVQALRSPGLAAIAEIKRASPSNGPIHPHADAVEIGLSYAAAGAKALSILTDETHFGGRLADLEAVRKQVEIPLLRKDFLLHPIQVHEARAAGADAILLIVAMLSVDSLHALHEEAQRLGMDALVEVHTQEELDIALTLAPSLVGVNSRDLKTMKTDLARTESLLAGIPSGIVRVAESGIHTPGDRDRMQEAGADAMLVGTSLMSSSDPGAALEALLCG